MLLAVLAVLLVLAAVGGWLLVRPVPDPPGRADVLLVLAGREGWRSVTVVTSSYHRHRAGLLVGRCFPGTVHTVGPSPDRTAAPLIAPFAAREGVALVATLTVQQGC